MRAGACRSQRNAECQSGSMNGLHRRCRIEQQHIDASPAEQALGTRRQTGGQPNMALQEPRRTDKQVHIATAPVVIGPRAEQQHVAIGADLVGEMCLQDKTFFGGQTHIAKRSALVCTQLGETARTTVERLVASDQHAATRAAERSATSAS